MKMIHLFQGKIPFPKFTGDFENTSHLTDSFVSYVLNSEWRSYCKLWRIMWRKEMFFMEICWCAGSKPGSQPVKFCFHRCQTLKNVSYSQFTHDEKRIIGINPNFNVDIVDIETGETFLELNNSKRKYYFKGNSPQSCASKSLILSNGELYDAKSGKLIFVFDRLQDMSSGIFSISENEVIFGQEQWDLNIMKIRNHVSDLKHCFLRRTHNEHIYLGYKFILLDDEPGYSYLSSDLVRTKSSLNSLLLMDPQSLEIFYQEDMPLTFKTMYSMEVVVISRDGSRIVVRNVCINVKTYRSLIDESYLFAVFEDGENEKVSDGLYSDSV
ncbi:Protein VPRBP [Thelohanellus kitauei]|uniref:Protein VPRBP n=1 Tax=Thelohanellus kitauei TaxID=669202 RepID=A0A0C2JSW2_THEKT|nr:Protein VPRBP [Thelohanellus kitauei]